MGYKVVVVNGSPHENGCTARALREVIETLNAEGVETELLQIGTKPVQGCVGCNTCRNTGKGCVFDDIVNEVAKKLADADGLLVGTPVYYASPNGSMLAFMDRLFYSTKFSVDKTMKVGAAVLSCRRGGASSSFDAMCKYFLATGMPLAPSTYWNSVHGFTPEQVEKDLEGLQAMRNLGRNMAFMVKAIAAEAAAHGKPEIETQYFTSFHDGK